MTPDVPNFRLRIYLAIVLGSFSRRIDGWSMALTPARRYRACGAEHGARHPQAEKRDPPFGSRLAIHIPSATAAARRVQRHESCLILRPPSLLLLPQSGRRQEADQEGGRGAKCHHRAILQASSIAKRAATCHGPSLVEQPFILNNSEAIACLAFAQKLLAATAWTIKHPPQHPLRYGSEPSRARSAGRAGILGGVTTRDALQNRCQR